MRETVARSKFSVEAENAKLQIICEVQKKVSQLLGVTLPTIAIRLKRMLRALSR